MKSDSIWYKLFTRFPHIFFEIAGQNPTLADSYRFDSIEVKQTSFRIDGVFLPIPEQSTLPIRFCEVQFQKDETLYSRLFNETFLYLHQNRPPHDWQAVVIYPNRSTEHSPEPWYQEFFTSGRVQRIYLEDFITTPNPTLGIRTAQLIIAPEVQARENARALIDQAQVNILNPLSQQEFIELVETIMVYKLPHKSREEIEAMFGLSELKQTKVYQEALEEGSQKTKERIALKLLQSGMSPEQVSNLTELPLEEVQNLNAATQ